MKRLLLGLAVLGVAATVAAPASAGSIAPPPEARIWLGNWHTNQGEVIFNSVHGCMTDSSGQPSYCRLDGEWHQPVESSGFGGTPVPAGWKTIQGAVSLGPTYKGQTWEGCFPVPGTPSGTPCYRWSDQGSMLIEREGTKFIEGYWKGCAISEICTDHHPFRGTKAGGVRCPAAGDPLLAHPACGGPEAWPFTYEMLSEYGKTGADGIVQLPTTAPEVNPPGFAVTLKLAHGGECKSAWIFHAAVSGRTFGQTSGDRRDCELHVTVPRVGRYKVDLTGTVDGREVAQEQTIRVVNWLIVGLGDSLASGEGNPDIPRGDGRLTGRWEDPACHRSHYSWQSQVAKRLEDHDVQTSVTFVSLACSGAGIASGILGPYNGLHDTAPITPQLDEAHDLIGDRKVDAVLISVGINDLGFGDIVNFCATHRNCVDATYKNGMTLRQYAAAKVSRLPALYEQLKQRLSELAPPDRVYITVYPNELHAPNGSFCDAVASNALGSIDAEESQFLYEDMQLPLNGAIQDAFGGGGYHLFGGIQHLFDTHGYCAPAGDRWVVTLDQSDALQGDNFGTLHPYHPGHFQIGTLVWGALSPDLYHDGVPRDI